MAKKVNLGSRLALYPTPVTVIGADGNGKLNWLEIADIYECNGFNNFICSIANTYVNEENLDESGKIDYNKMHDSWSTKD